MNLDVIGLHPDSAMNIVVNLYHQKSTTPDKLKLLTSNRSNITLQSKTLDERFKSGQTIDINAGELLGLGLVASYFEYYGNGNTYQVVTGVEDSAKSQIENIISDGAIWHDQTKKKMPFQTVMFQGYFPTQQPATTEKIIKQINLKTGVERQRYPENCGLIVNVFASEAEFDLNRIAAESNHSEYNDTYIVLHQLPSLEHANIYRLGDPLPPSLTVRLEKHPVDDEWQFNYSDSTRSDKSS